VLHSCSSTEVKCPGDSISQLRLGFTRKADSTTTQFTVYCPGIPDNSNDTLISDTIYNGNVVPVQVEIPVDITTNQMNIYFDFIQLKTDSTPYKKKTDIIALFYNRHSYMDDLECGVITDFLINNAIYSNYHIDSVFIANKLINSDNVNHVEIYY
jgi:hypothetical protein